MAAFLEIEKMLNNAKVPNTQIAYELDRERIMKSRLEIEEERKEEEKV